MATANEQWGSKPPSWIWITCGIGGVLALLCCGGFGGIWWWLNSPPSTSPEAREPFPVSSVAMPQFPDRGEPKELEEGGLLYDIDLAKANPGSKTPGHQGQLWLYLPAGEHAAGSLKCVLIAPAGTNLLEGMSLGEGDQPEHLPYVKAGMAVVAYSLDSIDDLYRLEEVAQEVAEAGDAEAEEGAADEAEMEAEEMDESDDGAIAAEFNRFRDAQAGLVNARNALEFVLAKVPEVNPKKIYCAGHSSAGTLALLFAEHEPRLAGCLAYAPALDLNERFGDAMGIRFMTMMFPGLPDFLVRSSPLTHESRLNCPVFLFHAEGDDNVPIEPARQFADRLKTAGRVVDLQTIPGGDHYESLLEEGIPRGLEWLKKQP